MTAAGVRSNWRDVPLPKQMRALARDSRGYPIPFIVLTQTDGKPCFTINDSRRLQKAFDERRCGICGTRMKGEVWFVGGPRSAFDPNGAYGDGPLHHDCMNYAMRVCPYLAVPIYSGRLDASTVDLGKLNCAPVFIDTTQDPERPQVFAAIAVRSYGQGPNRHFTMPSFLPARPYLNVEFWQHGVQISDGEGMAICRSLDLEPEKYLR